MARIKGSSLRELIEGPLPSAKSELKVADLNQNHVWNWSLISFDLPQHIKEIIKAIPIQMFGTGEDSIMWTASKDGEFSTNSAYHLATLNHSQESPFCGCGYGKLTLPKIIHFLWLCLHNSVPVKGVLASGGISCSSLCPVCNKQEENIIHVLYDCEFAQIFWDIIQTPIGLRQFGVTNMSDWLKVNYLSQELHQTSISWRILFPFAIWSLWKHRNKMCFKNAPSDLSLHKSCINQALEYFNCVGKIRKQNCLVTIKVRWIKPPRD